MHYRNDKEEIDYRDFLIRKKVNKISFTIFIGSGKGGVGKSLIATVMGMILSNKGYRTGLLDLDMHGPSSYAILNIQEFPREEKEGLIPPMIDGLKVMSIGLFSRDSSLPLSGPAKREILKELLAVTDFNVLDYLIVDLPPGTGDESLAAIKYLTNDRGVILVSTPSLLSLEVVRRAVKFFIDMNVRILGLVENMVRNDNHGLTHVLAQNIGVPFLGYIPYDEKVTFINERLEPKLLINTKFAETLKNVLKNAKILS